MHLLALAAATTPGGPFDSGLYKDIADAAGKTPWFVHLTASVVTQLGLFVVLGLFALAWWHARRGPARAMALTLLGVVAIGVSYLVSTGLKDIVQEVRPCRTVAGVTTIDTCPAATDWSFPSNHAVLAAAAAVALILVWRQLGWIAVPLALLVGVSRVFIGVHYPHDVAAGDGAGGSGNWPCAPTRACPLDHRGRPPAPRFSGAGNGFGQP
ncbi:phosphatase PAP2 family protein [Fodinicola feengrottensis]|uniref:phosphatase PAP2 family protein n=1 Tax=Fodinicola feengrottensis TaxID=435914 RepID=UPI0013D83F55|nr:phosphatase PAP2 family protein [Fodinicola feengrottensis]